MRQRLIIFAYMEIRKVYIETYGCQMNVADSEVVRAILASENIVSTLDISDADIILINTCSIRDNAEQRVIKRLSELASLKQKRADIIIGVIGCMAERMKETIFEKVKYVDLIAGPDAYRDLPRLIDIAVGGEKAANVLLSTDETYADINPLRLGDNGVNAFISIMRGCENFCAYCVVPYTRGKERSRNFSSIVDEAKYLFDNGYREVTLLGQNVNSYKTQNNGEQIDFPKLIKAVAQIDPMLRVRFSTSHPKDFSDDLIEAILQYDNICKSVHLPMQSGSTSVLKRMRRSYTFEWYLERVETLKKHIPQCSLSTDIIAGFCGETEQEHQETIAAMNQIRFNDAFMFKYSERPNTIAAKKYKDDVPDEVKSARLTEIIELQNKHSLQHNKKDIGKEYEVLIEGSSKRSDKQLYGRNSQNKVIVFDDKGFLKGTYIKVKISSVTSATLLGDNIY